MHAERWRANCRASDQSNQSVLPAPQLDLGGKEPNKSWNASSLAFLGDSVYELYARRRCFHPPKSAAKYREAVIQLVRAEAQSAACAKLSASGILTEAEAEVLRWGKNAPGTLPKRLERAVYRDATGMSSCVQII
jgi:ribonuclease-3 family protein